MSEAPSTDFRSHVSPCESLEEPLQDLQLRVARRADELAAALACRTPLNLLCWLQAEEEILHRLRDCGNKSATVPLTVEPVPDPLAEFLRPPFAGHGAVDEDPARLAMVDESLGAFAHA